MNAERVGVEPGKAPADWRRKRYWKGRVPDGQIRVTLTLSQAKAVDEISRGIKPTHHTIEKAFVNAGKRVAKALQDWMEFRPKKGMSLGHRRDERLRMLRLKRAKETGMYHGTDIVKKAIELGYDMDEANVCDIELGRSRNPTRHKLEGYCAAAGISFAEALALLPRWTQEAYETRPVALPERIWKLIDEDEELLSDFLTRYFGGEEE